MRSSACSWSFTSAVVVFGMAALMACGGPPKQAKTGGEGDQSSEDKTDKKSSTEDRAPTEPKTAEPDQGDQGDSKGTEGAGTGAASNCSIDVSKPATSKIGTVKVVTGCVSAEKTLKLLEQYFPQLHACFSGELKTNKKAKGEVTVKINVGQKGTYSVRVHKDDITSEEFIRCMVGILEPLPYPKPESGGATIEYTTQLK